MRWGTMVEPGTAFWNIPDKGAMLAAVAMLALAAASVVLAWLGRTRHLGVCLFLFTGTILFRVLYLIPEFMPEYRIYPGLPWFCLGGAIFLAGAWKWMFPVASPRIPAVVMLAVLAVLSAKRSFQWHDLDRLMADVLEQYPAQGRAVWELHDRDLGEGNYQAIIDRHEKVWPEVRRKFLASLEKSGTVRQLPTGHFSLAEVAATGRYARATGHLRGAPAGLMLMAQLEAYMQALRIDPETNPTHWRIFDEDKALLLEMAGKPEEARKQRDLRDP